MQEELKNGLSVERALSRTFRVLTPAAARSILRMKIAKDARDRAHQLSALNKKRRLTTEERSELEFYLQLGSLLTFLHSKARMALRPPAARPRRKSA